MSKIRLSHLLISLVLIAGMFIAALPTAPVMALSLPQSTSSVANLRAVAPSGTAATGVHVYIKDRHVTYEYRGDLVIVHVSETIVIERNGKIISERHVSYTYTRR
jgi:hypothetical protein